MLRVNMLRVTLSVNPLLCVKPPQLLRDLIRTCSIIKSGHKPVWYLSLLLITCAPCCTNLRMDAFKIQHQQQMKPQTSCVISMTCNCKQIYHTLHSYYCQVPVSGSGSSYKHSNCVDVIHEVYPQLCCAGNVLTIPSFGFQKLQ